MKTKISYSLLAATMACGMAQGAETAFTTPVGYITMNVAGNGTNAAPRSSYIAPSLPRPAVFSGVSLGTGTGAVVDFSGTPFASVTFGGNSLGEPRFYAEITTGPNAGTWTDILANTSSSITLATNSLASQFASQTVVIREFHTLTTLFTNSLATVPFKSAVSIGGADELSVLDSITKVNSIFYFTTEDNEAPAGADGWVSAIGDLASDKVISPMDGILVRRKATAPLAIVQSGEVKLTPTRIRIDPGFNIIPINRAIGDHLRLSPLSATSAAGGRTGINLVGSGLTQAVSIGGADELAVLDNGVLRLYFSTTEDNEDPAGPDGWVSAIGDLAGSLVIPEGSAIRIRRKTAAPFTWVIPAEPMANPITGVSN